MAARAPDDERLLRLVRIVAAIVATILVAFTVTIDALGRLFIDSGFHVSEVLFASLMTGWLVILGLEGLSLLRRRNGDGNG